MFKHILIAVDGSDHSQQAVTTAVGVAKQFGSDVFVLHVREHEVGRAGAYPLETPADATEIVSSVVTTLQQAGLSARGEAQAAVAGHAAKHIVETAQLRDADLIVMGSRGLSDIAGLLLGSVTHKVTQLSHIPVLVVRAPEAKGTKAAPVGVGAETTLP